MKKKIITAIVLTSLIGTIGVGAFINNHDKNLVLEVTAKNIVNNTFKEIEVIDQDEVEENNSIEENKLIIQEDKVVVDSKVLGENINEEIVKTNTEVSNDFLSEVEKLIYRRVNDERSKNGRSPLTYNNSMENYARIKSKDMGDKGYFSHKDLDGKLITERMKQDGVSYSAWAENIAFLSGYIDNKSIADEFMNNWMNSQGHRENILSNNYNSIGIGVYKIGNSIYATQEFYR